MKVTEPGYCTGIFSIMLITLLQTGVASGQIGRSIPSSRIVDWTRAGYHQNPNDNLPQDYSRIFYVPSPTGSDDYNNIHITLDSAKAVTNSMRGFICVKFRSGIYRISKPIYLSGVASHNIVFKGNGPDSTVIMYDGPNYTKATIFKIDGHLTGVKTSVNGYNKRTNTITLLSLRSDISEGDYLLIQLPTGNWNDALLSRNKTDRGDYISQIDKVVKVDGKQIQLKTDFSTIWDIGHTNGNNVFPYVTWINPIQEIGIQDIKLTTAPNEYTAGFHIQFNFAINCWVKNIESIRPVTQHVNCNYCDQVEIRKNYFTEAFTYGSEGGNGSGYGVALFRSTLCLIEDNIFEHLRHAVSLSMGSNRNVVGYNYSFDQYSDTKDKNGKIYRTHLSDMILHGFYPFANLFEGNWVGSITADDWWGSNGPYNTFFRNYTMDHTITLQQTNYANVLGNEAILKLEKSYNIFDRYGEEFAADDWSPSFEHKDYLPDISYYHKARPSFVSSILTWPPIGPPIVADSLTSQNIPARIRSVKENPAP